MNEFVVILLFVYIILLAIEVSRITGKIISTNEKVDEILKLLKQKEEK